MAKTFEYNPNRGSYYEIEDDEASGGVYISTKQDTTPVLENAKRMRNSGENDKVGDFNHYATIPAAIELVLREKGINIYDKGNTKAVIREIETNYPYLKVTNLRHSV